MFAISLSEGRRVESKTEHLSVFTELEISTSKVEINVASILRRKHFLAIDDDVPLSLESFSADCMKTSRCMRNR